MFVKSLYELLRIVNPWKTLFFNLHYFPLRTALKTPFFIYWRTQLHTIKGQIEITAPIKRGMVHVGVYNIGIKDSRYQRTIWQCSGRVIINGDAVIGSGSRISVGSDGILDFGKCFKITGNSEIICHKHISFGNECLLSWDTLIMDTDFHQIIDKGGNCFNSPMPISIGNHVWIGCRNTILKGVSIADNTVIAANSTITKSCNNTNVIIGAYNKVLKTDIDWKG